MGDKDTNEQVTLGQRYIECVPCKYVFLAIFSGISIYCVRSLGKVPKKILGDAKKIRNHRIGMVALGTYSGILGLCRLMDIGPFSTNPEMLRRLADLDNMWVPSGDKKEGKSGN